MKALVKKWVRAYLEVEVPDGSGDDEILTAAYEADPDDWEEENCEYLVVGE
jgi:hypothetical protein